MPDIQRRMLQDGALIAVLTVAGGILTWSTTSRWLPIAAFALVCYLALRVTGPRTRGAVPLRAWLLPALLSLGVLAALAPVAPAGFAAYPMSAAVTLAVWSGCAWWLAR